MSNLVTRTRALQVGDALTNSRKWGIVYVNDWGVCTYRLSYETGRVYGKLACVKVAKGLTDYNGWGMNFVDFDTWSDDGAWIQNAIDNLNVRQTYRAHPASR